MERITEYLSHIRRTMKLHESLLKTICGRYGLTLVEAQVVSFLHNNPTQDTAGDIVELRMLSKGNVSQAVERLIQKSMLARSPDAADRRKIHLRLLAASAPVTKEIDALQEQFHAAVFQGLSPEEYAQFEALNRRVIKNVERAAQKKTPENDGE